MNVKFFKKVTIWVQKWNATPITIDHFRWLRAFPAPEVEN